MIEETALQVLNMVNLSAELFKIETGRFVLDARPVNLTDILQRILEISHTSFAEKRLTFAIEEIEPPDGVSALAMGDATFCHSLFHNLIKNACEAAPRGSHVLVTVDDSSPLQVSISNKGTVPLAIRERFFEKFTTAGKVGGTGLGAYSARLLTEAQNGSIVLAVSDDADQTTITVCLPRCIEAPPLATRAGAKRWAF
jgi:hypothetical protein